MKVIFAILMLTIFLIGCNFDNKNNKKVEDTTPLTSSFNFSVFFKCKNASGLGSFIISPDTAQLMIDTFNKYYDKVGNDNIKLLLDKYWLDKCTIYSIANFLRSRDSFDGVRFCLTANRSVDPNQDLYQGVYKNKTSLAIIPTYGSKDETKKGHQDGTEMFDTLNCSNAKLYFKNIVTVYSEMNVFDKVYRNNLNTRNNFLLFSKSIWVDKCVILAMEAFLNSPDSKFEGLSVHMAAYLGNELNKPLGMENGKHQQSTLIFALTENKNGVQESNFSFLYNAFLEAKNKKEFEGDYRFNHGDLCPKSCDLTYTP